MVLESLTGGRVTERSPIKWNGQSISQLIKIPSIFLSVMHTLSLTQPAFVLGTEFVKASNEAQDFLVLDICQACCKDIFHHTSYAG